MFELLQLFKSFPHALKLLSLPLILELSLLLNIFTFALTQFLPLDLLAHVEQLQQDLALLLCLQFLELNDVKILEPLVALVAKIDAIIAITV